MRISANLTPRSERTSFAGVADVYNDEVVKEMWFASEERSQAEVHCLSMLAVGVAILFPKLLPLITFPDI